MFGSLQEQFHGHNSQFLHCKIRKHSFWKISSGAIYHTRTYIKLLLKQFSN
ncbi:hypothetical protein HanRHA438_Chr12g0574621 [Helianthus annuus]|nr:hypothetical protein HanRHA438_Chr12g0574621 [Helianthus annuus]